MLAHPCATVDSPHRRGEDAGELLDPLLGFICSFPLCAHDYYPLPRLGPNRLLAEPSCSSLDWRNPVAVLTAPKRRHTGTDMDAGTHVRALDRLGLSSRLSVRSLTTSNYPHAQAGYRPPN